MASSRTLGRCGSFFGRVRGDVSLGVPAGDRGEYSAIGVYNQFVYVDPTARSAVVKLSANRRYGLSTEESDNREGETVAFIRAAIAALD